jgi:hypothetical protein
VASRPPGRFMGSRPNKKCGEIHQKKPPHVKKKAKAASRPSRLNHQPCADRSLMQNQDLARRARRARIFVAGASCGRSVG